MSWSGTSHRNPSRLAAGEEITELDDKRDVLYAYTWYAVRTGETGSWAPQ